MEILKNKQTIGTVALVAAGVLGGFAPIISKVILRELPPLTALFLGITIMLLVLMPLSIKQLSHVLVHSKRVGLLGLFWFGNVVLFILGVNFTTSVMSQLLYSGVPIFILLEHILISKQKITHSQVLGIFLGIIGILLILFQSSKGTFGFGSLYGDMLILLASLSWTFYLLFSKRSSELVNPIGLTVGSATIAWICSLIAMLLIEGTGGLTKLTHLSVSGWIALLLLGLVVRVGMIFLYQLGIKKSTALVASLSGYISTGVAAFAGLVFLGEILTGKFIFGSLLVLVGVFLTATLPLFKRS